MHINISMNSNSKDYFKNERERCISMKYEETYFLTLPTKVK